MWKYVSRRIRDSFERTYNVLEHHRSWTCGGNGSGEKSSGGTTNTVCSHPEDVDRDKQSASVVLAEKLTLCVTPFHHNHSRNQGSSSSSSSSSDDDFRRPPNCEFQQNVLGALTWSSAIVCGWYTSQMICRRRRHLRQDGWAMGRCRFSKTLLSPSQAFHSNLLSHWVLTAPVAPNRATNKWIESSLLSNDGVSLSSKVAQAFPITNVTNDESRLKTLNEPQKSFAVPQPTVTHAVQDLLKVVGDIEFQLGVQHMEEEHYNVAATHFKLGTSHHHSGATFNLGLCYELGLGVNQNPQMAMQCFKIAAEMGHPKALYNMGIYHVQGLAGLAKSRKTGRQYLMAAARLGQEDAIRALGWRSDNLPSSKVTDIRTKTSSSYGQSEYVQKSAIFQAVAVA